MPPSSIAPQDWHGAYDGFERFPRLAFAWEYLRRKKSFREACRALARRRHMHNDRLQVAHSVPIATPEACLFAASTDEDARTAAVFWHPDACSRVLRLLALPERSDTRPFELANSKLPATLLHIGDGLQHVLIRDGVRTLQLCVRGESLFRPVTLVLDTGIAPSLMGYRERALSCFHAYRASQELLERYFPPAPHAARLAFVLRALDGWLAGASHREIAVALYGIERVDRDWRDPRENLRDQVRHAITRGRTLMDHGYRAFLQ